MQVQVSMGADAPTSVAHLGTVRPREPGIADASTAATTADAVVADAWHAYGAELRGYLVRRTRDAAAADDLLQESFLRLVGECRAARCPRDVRAWLYRVAHNALVSDVRRRASAARAIERLSAKRVDEADPEEAVVRRDEMSRVDRALAELHPAGRRAIGMAAAGYPSREIATALGRSDLAGRALLHRSRLRVRTAVADLAQDRPQP